MFLLKKIVSLGGEREEEGVCDSDGYRTPEDGEPEEGASGPSSAASGADAAEEAKGKEGSERGRRPSCGDASSEGRKSSTSAEDSSLERFYDDLSETDSDGPGVAEDAKLRKILSEAGGGDVAEGKKPEPGEGRSDNRDNDARQGVVSEPSADDAAGSPAPEGASEADCGDPLGGDFPEPPGDDVLGESDESVEPCIVDYLGKENCKAEARLAARRQARVEAREIRLRELERQQKEQEENADKVFDMSLASDNMLRTGRVAPIAPLVNAKDRPATGNSYHSSRRSSENSLEDGSFCLRDIKHELKELDEKFRKAMIANAQLDNEKSELTYQVELLKDKLEDLEETHAQLARENREKSREHEQLKRVAVKLKEELAFCRSQLEERDKLIADYGLIIVGGEGEEEAAPSERVLVSKENAELLQQAGEGSLDVRLKRLADERNELLDEVRHLKLELEEERNKKRSDSRGGHASLTNGPLDEETSKLLSDYRFKLQKAEQDVSTLQANVARLESQVIRYKSAAESSEKAEDELKIEKRKLQRENRESIARIEELETANSHLMRRMDKLKNAKSTLLKEL